VDQAEATPTLDPTGWVDAHGDYLYRFALARLGSPDAAEEAVQEALMAGLAARRRFEGRATERTWLTAILKRKVADALRAAARRRARTVLGDDRLTDGQFRRSGKWHQPPDGDADPLSVLTGAELRAAVFDCLGRLPPRLREVIVSRYLDDRPAEAVGRALGVTAGNLWVLLHRGRLRLWRCLADGGHTDPGDGP
jgi:RNA polymerase sigma-70 factor (ECF subfamily)